MPGKNLARRIARSQIRPSNQAEIVSTTERQAWALRFAWQEKFRYDFWRPVLGICEHDRSNGPAGQGDGDFSEDCDIDWLPLGAPATNSTHKNFTPPFPTYPSGHATFGTAALQVTRLLYGVNECITMVLWSQSQL